MPTRSDRAARTYHILGIPLRTGSLYPGSEDDARAYRDARLVARMADAGCAAVDEGDLDLPSYLPHHSVPPIRNWPGPRVAWDAIGDRLAPVLREPGHVPLLIGCDCSYTKAPGRPATHDRPFVLRRGQTVEDVARFAHKDVARSLKYARVWGRSGFRGQHVGREHRLDDGDVVELHT